MLEIQSDDLSTKSRPMNRVAAAPRGKDDLDDIEVPAARHDDFNDFGVELCQKRSPVLALLELGFILRLGRMSSSPPAPFMDLTRAVELEIPPKAVTVRSVTYRCRDGLADEHPLDLHYHFHSVHRG